MYNGMQFDTFTLPNQLQVLAISDKRFVKSSAALAVMAGSMQNPDEHLGLAHFLEHMLFLGTEKFPNVGDYENFLNQNGGGHNAYTSIDHTNYFFDVAHGAFEGALERFSRFFVCPTFDEKYVEREKNAVNSEHEKNLKEDGRREYRFQQMITDPAHPFSKFATGDKETLKNANRDVVMDFYQKTYSSNLMRLVIMSNLGGDGIRKLAEKHFSDIVNKNAEQPQYSDQLFVQSDLPKFHQVESVRDRDTLKISFDMPDDLPFWKSKPTSLLAHLIGEEGEGSLLSFLKQKGWALGLETSTWWRMFHVRVTLTEEGKKHRNDVLEAIFSYIKLMKKEGLKDYIFNERKVLAEVDLKNIEPKSSMGRASNFSASMLYFPVEDFMQRYYLFHEKSEVEFNQFLDRLNVNNMQVTLLTQSEQSQHQEPYYGINYRSDDMPTDLIDRLKNVEIYSEFKYPEPNPYIPTDFSLVIPQGVGEAKKEEHGSFARIYSQVDTELEIPRGSLSLSFISNVINKNPRKYLVAKLFAKMKKEELNEWGYPARLAGLSFNISHGYNTLTLDVSGFSHHLPDLMENLLEDKNHDRRIDQVKLDKDTFERVKLNFKKTLLNKEHDAAYQQLLYEVGYFFSSASIHRKDFIKNIDEITLDEINSFAQDFFSRVAVRSYCFGNIKVEPVKILIDKFFDGNGNSGFTDKEVQEFENQFTVINPSDRNIIIEKGINNNNSQVSLYRFGDWSIPLQARLDVLSKLIEQPFFTELRTHQQLGYVVAAFASSGNGFSGLGTLIQSQTHGAVDIFNRSRKFMGELILNLSNSIKDEEIQAVKSALIEELSQKPNTMGERLSRFTQMAGQYHGDFDFYNKMIDELRSLSAGDLVNLLQEFSERTDGEPQISFLYQGVDDSESTVVKGFRAIEDVRSFKDGAKTTQPYKPRL